jgi:hypothetical protein
VDALASSENQRNGMHYSILKYEYFTSVSCNKYYYVVLDVQLGSMLKSSDWEDQGRVEI